MNNNLSKNRNQIIDIFCEFLEVSTHLILYLTEVYPMEFFQKRVKYGTSVVMSRHPELNGYIYGVIMSLREYLEKDLVENIYILIINSQNKPINRFVFTVDELIQNDYNEELNLEEITSLFKIIIARLWGCPMQISTKKNDEDLTFQFMVKLKGDGYSNDSKDNSKFPWILIEDEYLTPNQRKEEKRVSEKRYKGKERMDEDDEDLDDEDDDIMDLTTDTDDVNNVPPPKLSPIYSISNPSIKMQLYIEELYQDKDKL
ncbi:DNA-binding protein [Anaeromyces robustus]|uniref:DNA-binding protein n=1 Tax=Anaeromyces robustus TaxID=1754192 RepID=A0A1Y1X034_9FUNG|nr:DNA-binding protein [Anaeromyces robustus]|eukprot:ORX79150.1 DNA-binding protein [Anaeromyces robustus]